MSNKYIILSGSPRTGTSALCRLLKASGYNVAGEDFPMIQEIKPEDDEITKYLKEKHNQKINPEETINPKGFLEWSGVVMRGLRNTLRWQDEMPENGSVIKIMGRGLIDTDPALIDKIIFSLRHPFDTAHAQLSLKGRNQTNKPSTSFWRQDLTSFLKFKLAYPEIPCYVSIYDLFAHAQEVYREDLGEFLGKELTPIEEITPRERITLEGTNMAQLEAIYNLCVDGFYEMAYDLLQEPHKVLENRDNIYCPRAGDICKSRCDLCFRKEDRYQLYNTLIRMSEKKEIDWENEPCPREVREQGMTIQESIDNNFWTFAAGRALEEEIIEKRLNRPTDN